MSGEVAHVGVSSIAAVTAVKAMKSVSEAVDMRLLDMMLEQSQSQAAQLLDMLPAPPEAPHPYLGRNVDLLA